MMKLSLTPGIMFTVQFTTNTFLDEHQTNVQSVHTAKLRQGKVP